MVVLGVLEAAIAAMNRLFAILGFAGRRTILLAAAAVAGALLNRLNRGRRPRRRGRTNAGGVSRQEEQRGSDEEVSEERESRDARGLGKVWGIQRITIAAPGVLLKSTSPAELEGQVSAYDEAGPAMLQLCQAAEVTVVSKVRSDEGQEKVKDALRKAGCIGDAGIPEHKALFCETDVGKIALVRQAEPGIHFESCPDTAHELARFLPRVVLIGSHLSGRSGKALDTSPSLSSWLQE